jgi:hypothetical protein
MMATFKRTFRVVFVGKIPRSKFYAGPDAQKDLRYEFYRGTNAEKAHAAVRTAFELLEDHSTTTWLQFGMSRAGKSPAGQDLMEMGASRAGITGYLHFSTAANVGYIRFEQGKVLS